MLNTSRGHILCDDNDGGGGDGILHAMRGIARKQSHTFAFLNQLETNRILVLPYILPMMYLISLGSFKFVCCLLFPVLRSVREWRTTTATKTHRLQPRIKQNVGEFFACTCRFYSIALPNAIFYQHNIVVAVVVRSFVRISSSSAIIHCKEKCSIAHTIHTLAAIG